MASFARARGRAPAAKRIRAGAFHGRRPLGARQGTGGPVCTNRQGMGLALAQARLALAAGEVPVGAVVVDGEGRLLARARNQTGRAGDPTAHAELLALQAAQRARGKARLAGCTLYVTLEPCAMCAGAALLARVDAVVFGAFDPEAGCCGSVVDLLDGLLRRAPRCIGGVREAECVALLQAYFQPKRR